MDLIHQGKGNNRYTQRPYTLCHIYTLISLEWSIMPRFLRDLPIVSATVVCDRSLRSIRSVCLPSFDSTNNENHPLVWDCTSKRPPTLGRQTGWQPIGVEPSHQTQQCHHSYNVHLHSPTSRRFPLVWHQLCQRRRGCRLVPIPSHHSADRLSMVQGRCGDNRSGPSYYR